MTILTFAALKSKHDKFYNSYLDSKKLPCFMLRVHRSFTWGYHAEQSFKNDIDAKYIFLWIAFNAAYAHEFTESYKDKEQQYMKDFFRQMVSLDKEKHIYSIVWQKFPASIKSLLDNKFVYFRFWQHCNQVPGYEDWQSRLKHEKAAFQQQLAKQNTVAILTILFNRLYTLRNQLIHGGASHGGKINRQQVKDGADILHALVPLFIDMMMEHEHEDWGRPWYPPVNANYGLIKK